MAEFEIKCPHCGVALSIQEEWIGMTLECPECKKQFSVQGSEEEAPSMEQSPIGGNERSDDLQHSKIGGKNPPQGEKNQPVQNQPDKPAATSRKNRRVIFLIAGVFILLLAAAVSYYFITCSRMVSSAIADGKLLLSDPDNFPDTAALMKAEAGLDEVNSKYWFVFAKRRTEDIRNRLAATGIVVSVINEGESILRDGRSDKIQETIDKLKQTTAKYPFAITKRQIKDLIKQLETARLVVAVIDEGESVLRDGRSDKIQETIDKLKQTAAKYPLPFAKRRTENLIERLETARLVVRIIDEGESILRNGQYDKFEETINKLRQTAAKYPFAFASRMEDLIKRLGTAQIVVSVIVEGESILRNGQYDKFPETIDKLKQTAAKYPFPFAKRQTEDLIERLNAPIPSRDVVRILKINDPAASPQLTIFKEINQSNTSYLMILPLDRRSEVEQILRKMINIRSNWQEYDRLRQIQNRILREYRQLPQDNSIFNLRLGLAKLKRANQVGDEMSRPRKAAGYLHQEVDNWIQSEKGRSTTVVSRNNNTWILSNVRGPVVLLVWEIVYFGDKFFSYQGWYRVYEPSSPETWTLN